MFEPTPNPRVFAVGLGIDFPQAVLDGLLARMKDQPPEALARVTIYVNTRRMARRLEDLLSQTGAMLLPRILLITDLSKRFDLTSQTQAADPLARRLELTQLVRALLAQNPDLAPATSAYSLADSLAELLDEMQSEGVPPEALSQIDVAQHSEHWARSLQFIKLVETFFASDAALDIETLQRHAVLRQCALWQDVPPSDPIIVAGSTASRATTRTFMETVSRLPQGALILPGYDFDQPDDVWSALSEPKPEQDHPQYRFKALMDALSLASSDIAPWHDTPSAHPERCKLVSLALRPAPVTDAWLSEGPYLPDLDAATREISWIEAPTPRMEAVTIALGIRDALEAGRKVALITPDRNLTRQVSAALQRWKILPDDSAGTPLALSAPGRLLRQVASAMGTEMTSLDLLALLKHPLVAIAETDARGAHLRNTRDLELEHLRGGPPFPNRENLMHWAQNHETRAEELTPWARWVADQIEALGQVTTASLTDMTDYHIALSESICRDVAGQGSGGLWAEKAGEAARAAMDKLVLAAPSGGTVTPREYRDLVGAVIASGEVRDAATVHNDAMIWGTLEARVQGADLIIMAGLNDGTWPETPTPDPWLNRQMREDVGLLLPERNIGLSAHDFQQSFTAGQVWITRSVRNAEAETVPSRWLNRLRNLLEGLPETGKPAYDAMRARGDAWLAQAVAMEEPSYRLDPATRPSPRPPVSARPRQLSVTKIETLIRDPYEIYARSILDLKPLRSLTLSPDAPMRGEAIHLALENFIRETAHDLGPDPEGRLMKIAQDVFEQTVPWAATRLMWHSKLGRIADWFINEERARRETSAPLVLNGEVALERTVSARIAPLDFTLLGRMDRIDQRDDGRLVIYDYKTGVLPTKKQQDFFNKQLPLLAMLVLRAGIDGQTGFQVASTGYIGLGSPPKIKMTDYSDANLDAYWDDLAQLIGSYERHDQGYTARRAIFDTRRHYDYAHLSRFGEWDETSDPQPQEVGQ